MTDTTDPRALVERLITIERNLNNGFPMSCAYGATMQEAANALTAALDRAEKAEAAITSAKPALRGPCGKSHWQKSQTSRRGTGRITSRRP